MPWRSTRLTRRSLSGVHGARCRLCLTDPSLHRSTHYSFGQLELVPGSGAIGPQAPSQNVRLKPFISRNKTLYRALRHGNHRRQEWLHPATTIWLPAARQRPRNGCDRRSPDRRGADCVRRVSRYGPSETKGGHGMKPSDYANERPPERSVEFVDHPRAEPVGNAGIPRR